MLLLMDVGMSIRLGKSRLAGQSDHVPRLVRSALGKPIFCKERTASKKKKAHTIARRIVIGRKVRFACICCSFLTSLRESACLLIKRTLLPGHDNEKFVFH